MKSNIQEIIYFCNEDGMIIKDNTNNSEQAININKQNNNKMINTQADSNLYIRLNKLIGDDNDGLNTLKWFKRFCKLIIIIISAGILWTYVVGKNFYDQNGKFQNTSVAGWVITILSILCIGTIHKPLAEILFKILGYLAEKIIINGMIPAKQKKNELTEMLNEYNMMLRVIGQKNDAKAYEQALLYKSKIEIALNNINEYK